jgi:DNA replication protein DnaC
MAGGFEPSEFAREFRQFVTGMNRFVDAAYERRSIALSSNLHPAGLDKLMPKAIANATVDRLLHDAHLVLTAGDSIRLTQATAGKGVTPLIN